MARLYLFVEGAMEKTYRDEEDEGIRIFLSLHPLHPCKFFLNFEQVMRCREKCYNQVMIAIFRFVLLPSLFLLPNKS
jgi:hypothetical protein